MSAQILTFDAPLPRLLYWDASFLVHATYPAARYHAECYAFLELLSGASDTLSYISTLALDETIFAILQLKVSEDHPDAGFWAAYRENSGILQPYLGELRALVERLWVDPRTLIVGTRAEMIFTALEHMGAYSLLPRDALHLSCMVDYGIDAIATTDDDFAQVDGLNLFTCNPRILAQSQTRS
jgi:predicted nucleic acid-binding protein